MTSLAKDMTGKQCGDYKVIERAENSPRGLARWLCECKCGVKNIISGGELRGKESNSCAACAILKKDIGLIDLSGEIFGKWRVIKRVENKNNNTMWLCQCECGVEKAVGASSLKIGDSTQCQSCASTGKSITHGMSGSALYAVWNTMRSRCYNPNLKSYKRYGGRGISVCESWRESFISFYNDMGGGYSVGLEIDRINNNGNYEPANCRWVTKTVNIRNCSQTKLTTVSVSIIKYFLSKKLSVKKLASVYRVDVKTIYRIKSGETWFDILPANPMNFIREKCSIRSDAA
jgi:hypothetical protein